MPFAALDPLTAYSLWKLRQDVFVVEQGAAYPDLDGRDLAPETRHVVLEDDDGVGARLRPGRSTTATRGGSAGSRCTATVRGQGWADRLMEAALQVCPDRDVVLDAQTPLAGWYATLGFEVTGPEFLDDGIPHLPMRARARP